MGKVEGCGPAEAGGSHRVGHPQGPFGRAQGAADPLTPLQFLSGCLHACGQGEKEERALN